MSLLTARLVGSWPFTTSKIWSKKGMIHKPVHTMHRWISQGKVQQLVMDDGLWARDMQLDMEPEMMDVHFSTLVFGYLFDVPKYFKSRVLRHTILLRCAPQFQMLVTLANPLVDCTKTTEALVLCTYPQILDPCVRESSNFEQVLENAIVVIDEARRDRDEVGKRGRIFTKLGSLIGSQVDVFSKTQQRCVTVLTTYSYYDSVNASWWRHIICRKWPVTLPVTVEVLLTLMLG